MDRECFFLGLWFFVILWCNFAGAQAAPEYEYENAPAPSHRSKREVLVPRLNMSVSWNGTHVLSSGDILAYISCIQHATSTSADAANVRLKWLFPAFVAFLNVTQSVGPEIRTRVRSSMIEHEIDHLARHRNVCFSSSFVFDPATLLKPGHHFIATHTRLSWTERPISDHIEKKFSGAPQYITPWDSLSVTVEVPGCSSGPLIGRGLVKDYQITASSHTPGFEAFKARMGGGPGDWCAAVLDEAQFLQVDFIHQVTVTKISIQRRNTSRGVKQFALEYSLEGQKWKSYTEYGAMKTFRCSWSENGVCTHWIMSPFDVYSVRMRPISWNSSICLKMELYGCEDEQSPASCNVPLGMESGFITDDALSTSQVAQTPSAWNSRLNKIARDTLGGWLASPYLREDYLQIDLAVLHQITKIGVQGSAAPGSNFYVRKYTVMLSNDSVAWVNYTENGRTKVFDGPSSSAMAYYPTFAALARPAVTRLIRIFPQPQHDLLRVMRLEMYGCLKEPMPSYAVPQDFSRRSILVNNKTGDFYVCLYRSDRTDSSCVYTNDGYTWRTLNSRIVNVLAADVLKGTVYGLDRSNSYLRSSDLGATWIAISPSHWERLKQSSKLVLAKKIPENLLADDHLSGEISKLDNGLQWTASNTGIHLKLRGKDWMVITTWKCCGY